jgi:hypothetical protein
MGGGGAAHHALKRIPRIKFPNRHQKPSGSFLVPTSLSSISLLFLSNFRIIIYLVLFLRYQLFQLIIAIVSRVYIYIYCDVVLLYADSIQNKLALQCLFCSKIPFTSMFSPSGIPTSD